MTPTKLARWEVERRQAFGRFVLTFGVLKVGSGILVLEVIGVSLALIELRRAVRLRGAVPSVRVSDYFQIILQLSPLFFGIAIGAGLLLAGTIWFSRESRYRRASQRAETCV